MLIALLACVQTPINYSTTVLQHVLLSWGKLNMLVIIIIHIIVFISIDTQKVKYKLINIFLIPKQINVFLSKAFHFFSKTL